LGGCLVVGANYRGGGASTSLVRSNTIKQNESYFKSRSCAQPSFALVT
jgi:hypothetical protein